MFSQYDKDQAAKRWAAITQPASERNQAVWSVLEAGRKLAPSKNAATKQQPKPVVFGKRGVK